MNQIFKYILFGLLFLPGLIFAQKGAVTGKVIDNDGVSPLTGANVYLKDQYAIGTITDINGDFVLNGIPVGSNILVVSFLGYDTEEVVVEVNEDKVTNIEVKLSYAPVLGQEVVVTAQVLGQAKAINQQLNSESIANIVSADRIQELPDVNAAEAIARLPGISINRSGGEGQKVVVRGLEPKFNAITINGVRLPSNAGGDRSVDLSLISPELLDGIEVFKSPLPDMDAESIGGTVNLKLRKAPKERNFLARYLHGYNNLNDYFGDYKGVLQFSDRVFNDKLGLVAQTNIERFNRGGDFLTYTWAEGRTDPETGITDIEGRTLRYEDRQEIRRRYNGSLNLDYDLGVSSISLFGLYSRTDRDRFSMQNRYDPSAPGIFYLGRKIENELDLYTVALSGNHNLEKVIIDWNISTSQTQGRTPFDFNMAFIDNLIAYDTELNRTGDPRNFLDAANPDLETAFLDDNEFRNSSTKESSQTYFINFKFPFKLGEKINGYFKTGGRYFQIERDRNVTIERENFYYLGGDFTRRAAALFPGDLSFSAANSQLISIRNFLANNNTIDFEGEDGTPYNFYSALDPDKVQSWYESQSSILNNDRAALVNNYEVSETVSAGYAMFKFSFGDFLTVIPGFRYEYSDNEYRAGFSTINGAYGVNGFIIDTLSTQTYGEFLPHLHLKIQPLKWLDIRASYANTLARPDFNFITPRSQVNNTSTVITSGNPDLRHARSENYDLFVSAYKGGLGLLTFGVFYKNIDNIFIPRTIQLANQELADANGWSDFPGYQLNSYTNLDESRVWGYEIDLQTNLGFLPKPFNGLVINANYARLFSETTVFFLTSETVLVVPFPPIFETTYTSNERQVDMPSQSPHIFNLSLGYDYKSFSARVSGTFQGTKANSYNLNKDFDRFNLEFWRWDASVKQRFGEHWSAFLNINNFNNQQDISFTRNENFINTIQTYGWTGTIGLQYKL